MATYVVTGGAGFIGSNMVAALEARGHDVIVVDELGKGAKWQNLAKRRLLDLVPPLALVRGPGGAADLCLVGRNIRRRVSRVAR